MARKFTYEEVKYFIEVESDSGCKLISNEYLNTKSKLDIQCKCGESFKTVFGEFKNNNKRQCNICSKNKFTTKIFSEYVNVKFNGNYVFIGEYEEYNKKVKMKCTTHGNYETFPSNVVKGEGGCKKCASEKSSKNQVKSQYEYEQDVNRIHSGTIKVIGEYKNKETPIKFYCLICDNEWVTGAGNLVRKRASGCPECAKHSQKKKVTKPLSVFIVELNKKFNNQFKINKDEYDGYTKQLNAICTECNYIWEVTPSSLLESKGCPNCNGYRHDIDTIEYNKRLFEKHNGRITTSDTYNGMNSEMKFNCNDCGNEWIVKAHSVLNSDFGCRKCSDIHRTKNHTQYIKEVYDLVGDEYKVLGEYSGNKNKILMKHNKCNETWFITPNSFLRNTRCPNCKRSKGEDVIKYHLTNYQLNFDNQWKNHECRYKRKLSFDFYIHNNPLCIEFDGSQHIKEVKSWGGNKNFNIVKIRDKIKNQYCIDNNIPLIRIPYWEQKNIHYILDNVLHYFNIKQLDNPSTYNKEIVERYLVDENWNHDTYISWQHKENRYWLDKLVHNV